MMWSLAMVLLAPSVAFGVVMALFPNPDDPPAWRARVALLLERLADRVRRSEPEIPDPFVALRLQTRLGIVADHARALEADARTFALAERVIATRLAYDALLAEACRLAGVEVLPRAKGDPQERFREEVELAARGWSW
jgi:hypothetical protein